MTDTPTQLVPIEDDASLGPAMRALNPMQRAFVSALVQLGCSQTKAAELAGYSPKSRGMAWYLAHHPAVQAAILEEAQKLIRSDGPMALHVLRTIAQDPAVAARDRVKAATELLNRGGFHAITQHNVNIVHRTEAEKDAEIRSLAAELGLDAAATAKLLGKPVVTDAQFEELDPAREKALAKRRAQRRETPEEHEARITRTRQERSERGKREYAEAQRRMTQEPLAHEAGTVSDIDPTLSETSPGNAAERATVETEEW